MHQGTKNASHACVWDFLAENPQLWEVKGK